VREDERVGGEAVLPSGAGLLLVVLSAGGAR